MAIHLTLTLLVAVHLLAVNLAGAGPLVAVWTEWRGTRSAQREWQNAARTLATWSIVAAVIGIGLGLSALAVLAVWPPRTEGNYLTVLKQITPGRWWFIAAELVFYFACLAGYVFGWNWFQNRRWLHRLVGIAAGTNLLYHFPALFTIFAIILLRPELHGLPLDRALYRQLLLESETLARVLHVWLASFAVAGIALGWIGRRLQPPATAETASRLTASGGRWALVATLLQLPTGWWLLLTLPDSQQNRMLGGDVVCTGLLAGSILLSLALLHNLAMLSLGDSSNRRLTIATALLVGIVILMTATLHLVRA